MPWEAYGIFGYGENEKGPSKNATRFPRARTTAAHSFSERCIQWLD